jgi:hypothetical protein
MPPQYVCIAFEDTRMKKHFIIYIDLVTASRKRAVLIALLGLLSHSVHGQKKIRYQFPAAMPENVKAEYLKQCDKGKTLYEINCSTCHNTAVRRKSVIPDFTEAQLVNYELRFSNPNHESNIPETKVTAEELGLIIIFLTYKEKNKPKTQTPGVTSK